LMGATPLAIEKIFEIKKRSPAKTIGFGVTPAIYQDLCNSRFRSAMQMIDYPMGVIDYVNEAHPLTKNLPPLAIKEGKIGCFFRASKHIVSLAEYCYQRGILLMMTSANHSGEPIIKTIKQVPKRMLEQVDHVIEDDAFIAKVQRPFEASQTTNLDLTTQKILRIGIHANSIIQRAFQLGMLPAEQIQDAHHGVSKPPRSVMFLLSYKASSFDKLYHYAHADWFVLDLEDSCPPNKKAVGRANIQHFMNDDTALDKPVFIRINCQQDEADFEQDLALNYSTKINGFLLPMLRTAEDIHFITKRLTAVEKKCQLPPGHFRIIPIIETAEALLNAQEIATASPRICALSWGHADLAADTQMAITDSNKAFARTQVAWAAKSAKLVAIDSPHTHIADQEGLKRESQIGLQQGFDAKYTLHECQIPIVNKIFGIDKHHYESLSQTVTAYHENGGGMFIDPNGQLLAPPFIKSMRQELNRRIVPQVKEQLLRLTATPLKKQVQTRFHVGQVLSPKNHMTIDAAWVTQWKSLSYNCLRIENDDIFSKNLGFKRRPFPYQAMIHYGIAQVVDCFSSYSKYHLGILDGRQIRPAYCGDTFAVEMCITKMTPSSNGKYVIVESKINISNQANEIVLQMGRRSLFDAFDIPATAHPIPSQFSDLSTSNEQLAIEQNILAIPSSENTLHHNQLAGIELIGHDIMSQLDLSQSSLYCHFFRNVHPLHINHLRFGEVAMSGGVVLPVVCAIVKAELGSVYWEELIQTAHLNPVKDGDLIGAMSYITAQKSVGPHTIELTLRTYGIRN
ncbi:MAG: aldolase/citrate lyase family protein, partial [Bacteroidota bacterium]